MGCYDSNECLRRAKECRAKAKSRSNADVWIRLAREWEALAKSQASMCQISRRDEVATTAQPAVLKPLTRKAQSWSTYSEG